MRSLFTAALLVGALGACGVTPPPSAAVDCPKSAPAPNLGPSCVLYDKSVVGWTVKRAVFHSVMVGGSAGERAQYEASKPNDPAGYDAFWNCTGYATTHADAWCECPRGPNREFEDAEAAALKGHVVWIEAH
jgi:hypothetical protein